jgi:uncharacterized membrane protein
MPLSSPWIEALLCALACGVAASMRPWRGLGRSPVQSVWLAALVLLPWLWSAKSALPGGPVLQLSGAPLLVLMLGRPLTVLTLLPVAALAGWVANVGATEALAWLAWNGIVPATAALLIGLGTRRWLPRHLFVYILARGFAATALAMTLAGALEVWHQALPPGTDAESLLLAHWLIGWGEAFSTGALTAIFVAFRPEWLSSYTDRRYLPGAPH